MLHPPGPPPLPSEFHDDNPSRELSNDPPILALAHSSLLPRGIMGKLNLPTVSVVCDEKAAHLTTNNHMPSKNHRDARAMTPTYYEPPAKTIAPMTHFNPRGFAFLKKRQARGDAPASPPHERNTKDDSPIDTAVRRIQEAGFSTRAMALQIAGSLLDRIGFHPSLNVSNIDSAFKQFPLDNVEEIVREFQLFSILVHEEVMEGSEFIRAAKYLRNEGCYDGCKLLLRLIFDDRRIKLTDVESAELAGVASDMNLEHGMHKAISVIKPQDGHICMMILVICSFFGAIIPVHGGQKASRWWIG
ncbi:hypothetical protein ACEPAH_2559 [Sanghuangporus vaninii]